MATRSEQIEIPGKITKSLGSYSTKRFGNLSKNFYLFRISILSTLFLVSLWNVVRTTQDIRSEMKLVLEIFTSSRQKFLLRLVERKPLH